MTTGAAGARGPDAENQARVRVDELFERFNALTPVELGRIGLRRDEFDARDALHETVEAAARAAGRSALLGEARAEAREVALRRYAEGTLNPTWITLNWAVSEGTAEDRAAIVVALSDAAAAAVVADLVPPEVV